MNKKMRAIIDGDPIVWAIGSVVDRDESPLEFALHSVKLKLSSILDATECEDYQLWLTGKDNFRKSISTTYKANRKQPRPTYFNEIREYMVDVWGADITDGIEADDAIGLNYTTDDIIVSIDKDLDQLPGRHFNYNKERIYDISYDQGMEFFYRQMLMGDRADNIAGIRGIGPKSVDKLFASLSLEEMRCEVGLQYAIHFDDPETEWLTNSKLLWILR